jgi:hypothetical protein
MAGTRASDSQGEETVRRVIQLGGISGWDDKELGRMGDAAAVDVAKFVGGDNLSEQQAGSVLAVLQLAFSSPKLVATPSDREPRAALFVLRYLEATAANAAVKQRVAEARSLILQNYEKYKANP